ncbi:DUF1501 domain-containing protein [Robbsia sp. Bb-Pol-6]|uniref:DUF1501 domain-containing protein n=1 Tax=Robbsia betulipollinis TaxID=2981849 RepID=A0ABT3ZNM1_9BURK|nr:DUF1501 domain-containing protein [Robbsia betulipollinis]MCY0388148.1 DUF1501 domain-containing protein [Robbsia betulipollinis]
MNRRRFVVSTLSAASLTVVGSSRVHAASRWPDTHRAEPGPGRAPSVMPPQSRHLIVIELAGGNDGLNTVVPVTDPLYRRLRPTLALDATQTVPLDGTRHLHVALTPLLPLWRAGEFAIVEGVGARGPGLGHFRAAQVRRSGSRVDVHQHDDWLDRALAAQAAAGVPAGTVWRPNGGGNAAPAHAGRFSDVAHRAADELIATSGMSVMRLTVPGFDTHCRQGVRHATALTELAGGIAVLHRRLQRAGRWNDVVIMTTSEFGRAAAENAEGGTEHGGAAPQLLLGGHLRGGFHGVPPRLDAHGGTIAPGVDHRRVLAAILESWWGMKPAAVLADAPAALPGLFRV